MKLRDTVADLAQAMELPGESVSAGLKITLPGRNRAVVEHHRGLLGYSEELVAIGGAGGGVRLLGRDLTLRAMDAETVLVTGRLTAVEYD